MIHFSVKGRVDPTELLSCFGQSPPAAEEDKNWCRSQLDARDPTGAQRDKYTWGTQLERNALVEDTAKRTPAFPWKSRSSPCCERTAWTAQRGQGTDLATKQASYTTRLRRAGWPETKTRGKTGVFRDEQFSHRNHSGSRERSKQPAFAGSPLR